MRLILLLIAIFFISSSVYSAQLLIKAKPSWMENIPREKWKEYGITQEEYNRRWEVGDVVVVRPDDWKWGRLECPPRFVVIKVPINAKILKKLEEPLYFNGKLLKRRKWRLSSVYIEKIRNIGMDTLTIEALKEKIKRKVVKDGKIVEESNIFNLNLFKQ